MICTWTTTHDERTAVLRLDGDLDYTSAEEFTALATARLGTAGVLRIDCAALGLCDSSGLSALLMLRRRADAAGVPVLLDNRGRALDRLLEVTGTFAYLTGEATGVAERHGYDT
ncbi:STAS domain-containing protein [Amycolatopsis magusensis]|uniref:STAS domain-containing protein n=1 Tax=Amycolatopsis magusensis TaxID=882444 RepID=UPI003C2C6752